MVFVVMVVIGLAAGVLSVLLGVGGGVIMVPALVFFGKMPMKAATLTSLAVIVPTAIVGLYNRLSNSGGGKIDWLMAGTVAVGAVIGAWLGSKMVSSAPDRLLKQVFAFLLVFTAVRMLISAR
ncbi:MAG: sulfite exporter TauE/SafE family protein [Armatimonadetes bacterium]|nr:sulfite exporter TauE/SafE family protein [Armatimonadota bacterium]